MSSVSVALVNQRSEIGRLSGIIERFGDQHALAAGDVANINLVLDEIVINIIRHAYEDDSEHRIAVHLALERGILTIRVEDDGRRFDPLGAPTPNLNLPIAERPLGGLGIHIVRAIATGIAYRREADRNILTIEMTMAGA